MRTLLRPSLLAALAALLPLLGEAGAARADTIALRADPWCPYTCAPDADRPASRSR